MLSAGSHTWLAVRCVATLARGCDQTTTKMREEYWTYVWTLGQNSKLVMFSCLHLPNQEPYVCIFSPTSPRVAEKCCFNHPAEIHLGYVSRLEPSWNWLTVTFLRCLGYIKLPLDSLSATGRFPTEHRRQLRSSSCFVLHNHIHTGVP